MAGAPPFLDISESIAAAVCVGILIFLAAVLLAGMRVEALWIRLLLIGVGEAKDLEGQ